MASISQPINIAVGNTATTLYTAFVSGTATRAQLVAVNLCNTTSSDITVDVWWENAAASSTKYIGKTVTVPALGTASLTSPFMGVINTASDKWRAQGSAAGVDCVGAVVENG